MHRALITGGTAGIGAAFARAFAGRGTALVLVARNPERLDETAAQFRREYGVEVETLVADLSDREAQQRVADRLESSTDPVDVFVNNAGFSVKSSLLEEDLSQHDLGFEVMIRAVLKLGGAAGRAMRERGRGWIINVGSVSALVTPEQLLRHQGVGGQLLRIPRGVQLAGTGVQVTALMPGWVRTEFHSRAGIKGSSIPGVLWLDADRLAEDCLRDVARGKPVSIPSKRWKLIAAVLRTTPRGIVATLSGVLSHRRSREK